MDDVRSATATPATASYTLIGPDRVPYSSPTAGTIGGHRPGRIFGRLDCPSALSAIQRGGYVKNRVFFADSVDAIAAGYRPCAVCLPEAYQFWKHNGQSGGDAK